MLLWATSESNMVDILNLEENPTDCSQRQQEIEYPCCYGQQLDSNMADKHEIQGNALRAHHQEGNRIQPMVTI